VGEKVNVRQTISDGAGPICFAAIVRDLTGKASASGATEVCTETVEPPFFEGCALHAPARPPRTPWLVWTIVLASAWARRRR
jgi:MYXO-CTERM domain-containing protein